MFANEVDECKHVKCFVKLLEWFRGKSFIASNNAERVISRQDGKDFYLACEIHGTKALLRTIQPHKIKVCSQRFNELSFSIDVVSVNGCWV